MLGRHNRVRTKKDTRQKESHSKETRKTEAEIMILQTERQKKEKWKDTKTVKNVR